ncbi:beta-ketoacyl synthase N-terminal-like domain-containing protein [Agrobacterium sp. NPDC089420]|uniref:hotdog fold thioesterase n=1 Tax=Agrobacterium sp. NPDC089420 TaxID=3363918 RepID=UPI0038512497
MGQIAITGLGCVFPGSDSPDRYWRNLVEGRDCTSPLSAAELGVDPALYHHPEPGTADHICYNRNGHVRDFRFDAVGYRLPAGDLAALDPLFHWTMHAARQALEDSGASPQRCGLIAGNIGMPTHSGKRLMSGFYHRILEPYLRQLLDRPDFSFPAYWDASGLSGLNLMTGSHNATIAALALGLSGPTYAIDAACSSALYAIRVASAYLLDGSADMMLAGAVCHADHIYLDHGFNVLQAFPTDGRSVPFDRASQGLKAGEGAGIVALKRYEDALRDGDRIYGVIEAIGVSNDGGAKHMLLPDPHGQMLALQRAYAGLSPRIDYLECHATGTPAGDQVELSTIERFFGETSIPLLGANKANNGHSLTASGMASLLKVLLAMRHELIPATLDIDNPVATPQGLVKRDHIVRENRRWARGENPRRAGINAFGFGGVNGHMVLREHIAGNAAAAVSAAAAPAAGPAAVDIVGIAMALPGTDNVETFRDTIATGRHWLQPLPRTRWLGLEKRADILALGGIKAAPAGGYIESFDFDCRHFKLPPKVIGNHLLAHAFLLPVAERAFLDAGYVLDGQRRNIAVIVARDVDHSCLRYQARNEIGWQLRDSLARSGIALSAEQLDGLQRIVKDSLFPEPFAEGITGGVGNIAASRVAAHLRLDGPAFALCAHESSAFKGLQLARYMLAENMVEAVILASSACDGGLENMLHANPHRSQPVGEGCGVLMLEKAGSGAAGRAYARLRGLEIRHDTTPHATFQASAQTVAEAAEACLQKAGVTPQQISYLERYSLTDDAEARSEAEGLARIYGVPVPSGSSKSHYGHLGAAAGMLSLIHTALVLHYGLSPQRRAGPQLAAISGMGVDRAYTHILLESPMVARPHATADATPVRAADPLLVRVFTGRERIMAEIILDPANFALFGKSPPMTRPKMSPAAATEAFDSPAAGCFQRLPLNWQQRQAIRNARTNLRFMQTEQAFYRRLRGIMASETAPPARAALFDEAQLIELTDGAVSRVLGSDYAQADTYAVRTRMPSPPYMFASRITATTARAGALEPCRIEWELDLPADAWFMCEGKVPAFVALESSHAMIVAFTLIGCDQLFKGELRYRAVDSRTFVYGDMPRAGELLRGRVDIKSFLKVGRNILVSYEYWCLADDRPVFRLEANSGFFLPRDLERSKGVDPTPFLKTDGAPRQPFTPLRNCTRDRFDEEDIEALGEGDPAGCFGADYATATPASKLWTRMARMLDRVVEVDPKGGAFGLGVVVGERDIDPDHWAFKAHFKNDPCVPGTLLVEGCEQLLKFYLAYLGLYSVPGLGGHTLTDHQYSAKFRGEVKPQRDTLRYRLTCKSIDLAYGEDAVTLETASFVFVAEIIHRGNVIGICDNLGAGFARRRNQQSSWVAAA